MHLPNDILALQQAPGLSENDAASIDHLPGLKSLKMRVRHWGTAPYLKSFMNCILIGKTPGIEIWMIQDDPKWFTGPNILNFLNYFCSNLPKFHYGGFLSIGLAIFWYNLSENVFGVLKFQKKNYFVSLTFPKCDTFNGNLTFLALVLT